MLAQEPERPVTIAAGLPAFLLLGSVPEVGRCTRRCIPFTPFDIEDYGRSLFPDTEPKWLLIVPISRDDGGAEGGYSCGPAEAGGNLLPHVPSKERPPG
jgi:hypothetical protein